MSEQNDNLHTVSQICKLTGATPAQLKNWDREGLLVARRTGQHVANNRKLYGEGDIQLIREILLYRKLGFGIEQIKDILAAPKLERTELVAARTDELKKDYASIQRQIELSEALELVDPRSLIEKLDGLTDADAIVSAYDKDANLKQVIRWTRSHTDRDVEELGKELCMVLEGFRQLPKDADWELVEAQIARFCDVWSKPFGWPTVGQMLVLSETFRSFGAREAEDIPFDQEMGESLATFFLFAWASATLRCLDDILVNLYWFADEELSLESVRDSAGVLCALAAECTCRPHFVDTELTEAQKREFTRAIGATFDLLEEVALDEGIERYLHLDDLYTVDAPGMCTARQLTEAQLMGNLETWLESGGRKQITQRIVDWIDVLYLRWERSLHEEDEASCTANDAMGATDRTQRFSEWVEAHYARAFEDPPEMRWASEEEACRVEKTTRTFVEHVEAGVERARLSLEVDERIDGSS